MTKPRRFTHVPIYIDEHSERLARMRHTVRRQGGAWKSILPLILMLIVLFAIVMSALL